jgi:hypothetical protein
MDYYLQWERFRDWLVGLPRDKLIDDRMDKDCALSLWAKQSLLPSVCMDYVDVTHVWVDMDGNLCEDEDVLAYGGNWHEDFCYRMMEACKNGPITVVEAIRILDEVIDYPGKLLMKQKGGV